MTHKDIYTKFMIEYDKANVTSSYPSLTEYEVATVLDKAYNALIAQKVTGNNIRRATFESDIKSIADLGPLTDTANEALKYDNVAKAIAPNVVRCQTPNKMLYFLQATMTDKGDAANNYDRFETQYAPMDGELIRKLPVKLVNHEAAQKFFASTYNIPWIKNPVCYIEDRYINVVFDPLSLPVIEEGDDNASLNIVYIRTPNLFAKDLDVITNPEQMLKDMKERGIDSDNISSANIETVLEDCLKTKTFFQYTFDEYAEEPSTALKNAHSVIANYLKNVYEFECNDTVAEEVISLAIAFALENVESSRLNSKLNMRGLEA